MDEASQARDIAVLQIKTQVIERDLLKINETLDEQETRTRRLEDRNMWVMGAAAVIGAIFAWIGMPLLRLLAKAVG